MIQNNDSDFSNGFMNHLCHPTNQMNFDYSWDSLNYLSQMMNKASYMDPSLLEIAKQQWMSNIQFNLKAIAYYEQCQNSYSQAKAANPQFPLAAMMNMASQASMSNGNIFAPKPLMANRADTSRMGRSHSMFTPNIPKAETNLEQQNLILSEESSDKESESMDKKQLSDGTNMRKRMNVFKCPHTKRKHYAKNMCNNCYHKQGRNKKATKCPHKDRQNYAKGKCQNCYLNDYHKVKRRMKKQQSKSSIKVDDEVDRRISVETSSTEKAQLESTPQVSCESLE